MVSRKKASTAKKPPVNSSKNPDWTEAAAKTEISSIAFSDEFHAPIKESRQPALSQNKRFLHFLLLVLGLLVLAGVFIVLMHDGPLDA